MPHTLASTQDKPLPALIPQLGAAPEHFDTRWPWWIKLFIGLVLLAGAFYIDRPVAIWVEQVNPLGRVKGDLARELMLLEQFGQWTSTVLIIAAVALLDKKGRQRALAIGLGCLVTVLFCYLLKDLVGRPRPTVFGGVAGDGVAQFYGPERGFTGGSKWTSFPSAHTTGAFALACGLAWFYPRARGLFMLLALITATQRVLHNAHYVSDVVAGMILSVTTARLVLAGNLAGRLIALAPPPARQWWLAEPTDATP